MRLHIALAVAGLALGTGFAHAQTAVSESNTGSVQQPSRGMTMSRVEAAFGVPSNRLAAVGQPPITRWEYPGFIVYFEHQHVIHTVTVRPE